MFPDHFFDPINLVLIVSIVLAFTSVQQKKRRRMMAIKFGADVTYGIYMIVIGGLSGGLASLIAAFGSMVQTITPEHMLEKTVRLRLGIAATLATLAAYVSYKEPNDLLPIIGVIISRFIEVQKYPQRIRIGFLIAAVPWMIYNFNNEFYWPMVYNIVIATSLLVAIIRHKEPVTPKDVA